MAETKSELDKLDTETVAPPAAESTVVVGGELPSEDDKKPAVTGDAKVDDGGVRTNSAVEPVADALATGAGAPHPPPDNVDRDGREQFPGGVAPTALAEPPAKPSSRSSGSDDDGK